MLVSFELTMPSRASWNGRWSGEDRKYYVVKTLSARFIKNNPHLQFLNTTGRDGFYYRWEDGWAANVDVERIDAVQAKHRRKVSSGFCGYEWMITSILHKGVITTRTLTTTTE